MTTPNNSKEPQTLGDNGPRIQFFVEGKPIGKGRPRSTRTGRVYTPTETRQYEQQIAAAWLTEGQAQTLGATGELILGLSVIYQRPKSHYTSTGALSKRGKTQRAPQPRTDLDNIVKIIADALNGLAYHDDRQISTIVATRRWAFGRADPEGVRVTIFPYGPKETPL